MKRQLKDGRKLVNGGRKELVFVQDPNQITDVGSGGRSPVYATEDGELYIEWNGKWELIVHLGEGGGGDRQLGKGDWYEVVSCAGGIPDEDYHF